MKCMPLQRRQPTKSIHLLCASWHCSVARTSTTTTKRVTERIVLRYSFIRPDPTTTTMAASGDTVKRGAIFSRSNHLVKVCAEGRRPRWSGGGSAPGKHRFHDACVQGLGVLRSQTYTAQYFLHRAQHVRK